MARNCLTGECTRLFSSAAVFQEVVLLYCPFLLRWLFLYIFRALVHKYQCNTGVHILRLVCDYLNFKRKIIKKKKWSSRRLFGSESIYSCLPFFDYFILMQVKFQCSHTVSTPSCPWHVWLPLRTGNCRLDQGVRI